MVTEPAPPVTPAPSVEVALGRLEAVLDELGQVVVAFSGGVDSALLAYLAHRRLGPGRSLAVTAVSGSLPAAELAECRSLAAEWGLRWTTVRTTELEDPAYVANNGDRCRWCKQALMDALAPLAGGATVVLGVTLDDLGDHRPGQAAAAGAGARFPLVEAGFTKEMVRAASRRLGLRTWDKPAAACLASRVPYGTPVTVGVLGRIERAEAGLRALGFRDLRVRHYRDAARIEVPLGDLPRVLDNREAVVAAVKDAGYRYVTLDLEGLRSGNLNAALGAGPGGRAVAGSPAGDR